MKARCKKILCIRLIVYSLVIATGIFIIYQRWVERARTTFRVALLEELQKRDTLLIPYTSNMKVTSVLEEVNPGSVEIETVLGKRKYEIPNYKFANSIAKGGMQRSLLSVLLDECPLDADLLQETWSDLLNDIGIPLKTYIRISVLDFHEQASFSFSKNIQKLSQADSLSSYYMGSRCEVEATGYFSCYWWDLFSDWRLLLIFIVCACIELLFFIFRRIYHSFSSHSNRIMHSEPVSMFTIAIGQPHTYQLEEDVFFDAVQMKIVKKQQATELTSQLTLLLEMFLQAEENEVSTTEMSKALWPDGSGTQERIHTIIHRLRQSLRELTTLQIKFKNNSYHLMIPHFIAKKGLDDN